MKKHKRARATHELAAAYRIKDGSKFRLKDFNPGDTNGMKSKEHAQEMLQVSTEKLYDLQEKLYAQNQWALLVIFQAMDAAGKDGAIKHVMSGVNPQGCDVYAFKAPGPEELSHEYLWRAHKYAPERGKIGIFNRSYYEEVLVVRVHEGVLQNQRIPEELISKEIWEQRYKDMNAFEKYLTRNGIVVMKFFLHLSKAEQKKRFLERLEDSAKNWKFSMADVEERGYWKDYMSAYDEMIRNTATENAPWYVVPADNKWFTRLVVASAMIETLKKLDLAFPDVDEEKKTELKKVRESLLKDKD
jgi:PPK2 family polyphosphate:nucleotide phosphotransferase